MNKSKAEKIAILGAIAAFAAILSYIEALISLNVFIPGAKLGLANTAVVIVMYIYGYKDAFLVNIIRIIIVGLLFSNMFSILFSIGGAVISYFIMAIIKKIDLFSPVGVSVAGGVAHNIGQIIIAIFIIKSYSVINYLPVLMIAGIICGFIIGIVALMVIRYLSVILRKREFV